MWLSYSQKGDQWICTTHNTTATQGQDSQQSVTDLTYLRSKVDHVLKSARITELEPGIESSNSDEVPINIKKKQEDRTTQTVYDKYNVVL